MAYVPALLILAGMAAYTVLAGADFGAGLWTLFAAGPLAQPMRDHARHAMGPVWEANHVWLIFVLVIAWTGYPVAFGSIASTLAAPLLIAAIGIIFRGAGYALRGQGASPAADLLFAVSSIAAPFALGTAVGAIALGRVPVGNAAGNLVTSWLNPGAVLIGVLAVAFSGYLAAVYLAADAQRYQEPALTAAFRRRALITGLVSGALALAGLLVTRGPRLGLTHGAALGLVLVSAAGGLATLGLCWRSRFGLARLTAALAVVAVVAGWAFAQAPRLLPGLTVTQAAAGRGTLTALIIAVCAGSAVLVPSLALLFTLFLRGRLDTPDTHALPAGRPTASPTPEGPVPGSPAAVGPATESPAPGSPAPGSPAPGSPAAATPAAHRARAWAAAAVAGLLAGAGLLVFGNPAWTHATGVACLVLCAVAVFALSAPPSQN